MASIGIDIVDCIHTFVESPVSIAFVVWHYPFAGVVHGQRKFLNVKTVKGSSGRECGACTGNMATIDA